MGEQKQSEVEGWGWTGELEAASIRTVAPVNLELWLHGSDWVNRRVETVELLDVNTVRLRLSVDFRIPTKLPGSHRLAGTTTFFLPLTVLPRRTSLAYFDLRDEAGGAVPMFTRQENARLTGAMLVAAARRAIARLELGHALTTYLATIPTKSPADSRVFVRSVLDPVNQLLYPDPEVPKRLLGDRDFRDLLGLCASCSFIHVPLASDPGERRIIKLTLLSPWDSTRRPQTRSLGESRRRRVLRSSATWLGWRPETRYMILPHVGNAESFHLQLAAPPHVEFIEAGMRNGPPRDLVRPETDPSTPNLDPPPKDQVNDSAGYQQRIAGVSERKHLYVELAHSHLSGIAWVRFRVIRHGFLRAAPAVGWLVVLLLAAFALRADEVVGESQTAAAVLLLVPALIAGFLVAPGEHAMTRHLLRGPRLITAGVGLIALLATTAMLTLPEGTPRAAPLGLLIIWAIGAAIAAVLSLLLSLSAILPRPARHEEITPPTAHHQPFGADSAALGPEGADGNV